MTSRNESSGGGSSLRVYDRVDPIELDIIPEEPPSDASSLTFGAQRTPDPPSTKGLLATEDEQEFPWLPRPSNVPTSESPSYDSESSNTWPLGIKSGLFLVAGILVLNATITMWASLSFPVSGGIGTLHVGPCRQIRKTGLGIHIIINCIGTLLLGASNFCMQCLTSPTRNEVDSQHLNKKWLEVGVLSMKNLRCINRKRVWLWFFLGLSSVPIHLMFNSGVFVNLTANRYTLAAVSSDFENGASWDLPFASKDLVNLVTAMQSNASSYERLSVEDCIKDYGVDFLYNRRHVLVATQDKNLNNSIIGTLSWSYDLVQNSWICGTNVTDEMILTPLNIDEYDCTVKDALSSLPLWVGEQFLQVDHCLSQRVPDKCRLQFSLPIMFIVILCNIVKLGCILLTLLRKETTLITMGDTIASFLRRRDETTKGMCTITRQDIRKGYWPDDPGPKRWIYQRHFRWEAVGWWRWVIGNSFCVLACVAFGILLWEGIDTTTTNPDMATWWSLGFGEVTSSSIIRWRTPMLGDSGLIKMVLLANLPQIVLSAMYMVYNQIYTCMAFADEYASYFHKRQPLRVTRPRGLQQSTRFLTLPYRYMVPLMAASAGTHFILSQAFFLVAVDVFDDNGHLDRDETILTVGFSIIALVVLVIVVCIGATITLLLGFRRFRSGMPLAGPCSAAISAACHPAEFESGSEAAERLVQWGVVGSENGVGHLAFSSGVVSEPISGRLYM